MGTPIYVSINAYTPLVQPQLYDADVVLASIDNILRTPPRTRLFRPQGFDPETYLFREDRQDLPQVIYNDVFRQLQQDSRVAVTYNPAQVVNDFTHETLSMNLTFTIQGLPANQPYQRALAIALPST